MIRIATICLLISMVRSQNCSLNDVEVEKLKDIFHQASNYITAETKNKDAIICFGAARAGKSTLLNYLIGTKLKGVRTSKFTKITLEKVDNRSPGPEIGAGTESKTIFPSGWKSQKFENVIIWDSPGFGDNRGPIQDISNAFYLYQLLSHVNALKIVLVVSYENIISDNISTFLSVLKNIEHLFGDKFGQYFSSMSLIISKAPYVSDNMPIDNIYIKEVLEQHILSITGLDISKNCIGFLEYITRNSDRIGLFRSAKKLDEINSDIDYNIVQAIRNSGYIQKELVKDIHPSISASSQLCLLSARLKLVAAPEMNGLKDLVANFFNGKLTYLEKNVSSVKEIKAIQDELSLMQNNLRTFHEKNLNTYKGIELLKTINVEIENKIKNDDMLRKVELLEFINMVLQEPLNGFRLVVRYTFDTALEIIAQAIVLSSSKLGEITAQELLKESKRIEDEFKQRYQNISDQLAIEKSKMEEGPPWWHYVVSPVGGLIELAVSKARG